MFNAFVEKETIKIRRKKLFCLLDMSSPMSDQEGEMLKAIINRAKYFDTTIRIGLLGFGNMLDESSLQNLEQTTSELNINIQKWCLPIKTFTEMHKVTQRGRFITPLIEGAFTKFNEKEFELIVFNKNPIYDFKDWQEALKERFNKILLFNFSAELNMYPNSEIKYLSIVGNESIERLNELVKTTLFESVISDFKIFFDNKAIPFDYSIKADTEPIETCFKLEDSHLCLTSKTGLKARKLDINLCVYGETSVDIAINNSHPLPISVSSSSLPEPKFISADNEKRRYIDEIIKSAGERKVTTQETLDRVISQSEIEEGRISSICLGKTSLIKKDSYAVYERDVVFIDESTFFVRIQDNLLLKVCKGERDILKPSNTAPLLFSLGDDEYILFEGD
ncbi:MAG: hypothetical protein AB1414_09735 [bacterium]